MRPTTAYDDNVIGFDALLHPGTVFDHPSDVLADHSLSTSEKRAILVSWASRRLGDCFLPVLAGAGGTESAGYHRRDPRGALRTRRWSTQSPRGQAQPSLFDIEISGRLRRVAMDDIALPREGRLAGRCQRTSEMIGRGFHERHHFGLMGECDEEAPASV